MKNANDIKKEISDLHAEIIFLDKSDDKKDVALRKKLRAKLPQLKQYLLYLETNPTREYLEKESARLSNRLNEIEEKHNPVRNPERFTRSQVSIMKKAFEREWDLPKIRKQLKAINYILR